MIDIIKKSYSSKYWEFFFRKLLNIEIFQLMFPKIFLDKINDLKFNLENIYRYKLENPKTKYDMGPNAYQSHHNLQDHKNFYDIKIKIEKYLNLNIKKKIFRKKTIGKFKIKSMWFVIMKENSNHNIHCHPKSVLSGIIYIKTITKNASGALKILIPNFNMGKYDFDIYEKNLLNEKTQLMQTNKNDLIKRETYEFIPNNNDIIIFNSYMYHWIEKYKEGTDRISIAWDAIYTI